MKSAVRVSQLSKVYKLYWGPRSLFREMLLRVPSHQQFWALKEISFEVSEGEAFGIIGENGAGKTTLLQILAGSTSPTSGSANVEGKASALLELTAGFHPDVTGRENTYFSGALAGLSRAQIQQSESEIIAFSELEEFIDKPVKTYSSGMYVRLGFALATGFNPSILVIDEALAVGDQRFQKKCTDRILSFKRKGCTILFCSHNLYQVKTLCEQAIWLKRGRIAAQGVAQEVVDRYTDYVREDESKSLPKSFPTVESDRDSKKQICWIEKTVLSDAEERPRSEFESGDTLQVDIWCYFGPGFEGIPAVAVALVRNDGVCVSTTSSNIAGDSLRPKSPHHYHARVVFPETPLLSGRYYLNVVATDQEKLQAYDIVERAQTFTVSSNDQDIGLVRLPHYWIEPK